MSKKSKSASKERNRKKKAQRKANNRAKYESFMRDGKNTKSKRNRMGSRRKVLLQVHDHPHGSCGNAGCIRCFGATFNPFLKDDVPHMMPQWMFLRWREERAALRG